MNAEKENLNEEVPVIENPEENQEVEELTAKTNLLVALSAISSTV